jgi:hypothetical protein
MARKDGVHWQPIEKLDYVLTLIRTSAPEARQQLEDFRSAGPGSLDQAIVERAMRVYSDSLEMNALFHEQLVRWRKLPLTRGQEKKVEEAEGLLKGDDECAREIIAIASRVVTIDRIVSMREGEVTVRPPAGESDSPPRTKRPRR